MGDMPLSIAPAAGAGSPRPIGYVQGAWARLSGLGLTLIALGPLLVTVAGIGLAAGAVTDVIRQTSAKVAAAAAIVEERISPQIDKVESAVGRVAAPLSQLKDQIDGAMSAVDQLGSVRVARGEWGSTPSVHVKIPPNDLSIGSVSVDVPFVGSVSKSLGAIDSGAVFNQATPSVPIPPEPLVLSMEPVQKALSPLGPNGPAGKAIRAAESAVDAEIGEVGKLWQPIRAIRDGVIDLLAPLQAVISPIVTAIFVVLIALAAQVLLYLASTLVLIRSRPAEFTGVLVARGPIGLLGYSYRALLQRGFAQALGRTSTPAQEGSIADLQARAARLQAEIARLRADFVPTTGAATL